MCEEPWFDFANGGKTPLWPAGRSAPSKSDPPRESGRATAPPTSEPSHFSPCRFTDHPNSNFPATVKSEVDSELQQLLTFLQKRNETGDGGSKRRRRDQTMSHFPDDKRMAGYQWDWTGRGPFCSAPQGWSPMGMPPMPHAPPGTYYPTHMVPAHAHSHVNQWNPAAKIQHAHSQAKPPPLDTALPPTTQIGRPQPGTVDLSAHSDPIRARPLKGPVEKPVQLTKPRLDLKIPEPPVAVDPVLPLPLLPFKERSPMACRGTTPPPKAEAEKDREISSTGEVMEPLQAEAPAATPMHIDNPSVTPPGPVEAVRIPEPTPTTNAKPVGPVPKINEAPTVTCSQLFSEPTVTRSDPPPPILDSQPTVTASVPTLPASEPNVTASEPTVAASEPMVTASEPTVTASEPTPMDVEPTVSDSMAAVPDSLPTVSGSVPEPTIVDSGPSESQPTVTGSEPTIEEKPTVTCCEATSQPMVSSTSTDVKPPAKDTRKKKKKVIKKRPKSKVKGGDVTKAKLAKQAKPVERRGPVLQVTGPRDTPNTVTILNGPRTEDDDEKRPVARNSRPLEHRGRTRHGLFSCTLSTRYDAVRPDPTWICVFCKLGSHGRGLGDLFGPYVITRDQQEEELCEFSGDERDIVETQKRGGRTKKSIRANQLLEHFTTISRKLKRRQPSDSSQTLSGILPMSDDEGDVVRFEVWTHEMCAVWSPGVCLVDTGLLGLQDAVWHCYKAMCSKCGLYGANIGCIHRNCPNRSHYACAVEAGWSLPLDTFISTCHFHVQRS